MLNDAATHSHQLGYRWNPQKCVILNHPTARTATGAHSNPLTLYGVALPTADEVIYLGIPFTKRGISSSALARSRSKTTLAAMATLHKMGAHRSGFSLSLSARLYCSFIRPKFEYGVAITMMHTKDINKLEQLQNRCLRLLIGGNPHTSTTVLKILTMIPAIHWRMEVLQSKYCLRLPTLPADSLVLLLHHSRGNDTYINKLKANRLYKSYTDATTITSFAAPFLYDDRQKLYTAFRDTQSSRHILARACRAKLEIDPILTLPATRTDRSRLIRWRLGWLLGAPHDCNCDRDHTSRRHFDKYECDAIPSELWESLPQAPPTTHTIDHALNRLPTDPSQYCHYWPVLLTLLWYIECLVKPNVKFPEDPDPGALWRNYACGI
ncbi:hypothetical protein BX666DRAFT_2164632 [Dichotomocladium elegans]|nr:hypothetical protein BX666DRAFT_2164632 [Dichotomocladium elegans]